ncbi:MAG: hypothetical protein K2J67_11400, partial [Lachnospiraceae bacterium]|nr:hypothetical protein [Lachnospiraceae bacterium]
EAVKLVVTRRMNGLRGFVNGVLRNMERHLDEMTDPDQSDFLQYASVKYSMPTWIVSYFLQEFSQEMVEEILQSYLDRDHSVCIRCNVFLGRTESRTERSGMESRGKGIEQSGLKCPQNGTEQSGQKSLQNGTVQSDLECTKNRTEQFVREEHGESAEERIRRIKDSMQRQGVVLQEGSLFREAFHITGYDRLDQLEAFRQGIIQVQAESSMVVGKVSGITPGQTVIDV